MIVSIYTQEYIVKIKFIVMPIQPDMAEHIPIPGDILFLKQNISNMPLQAGDIKS